MTEKFSGKVQVPKKRPVNEWPVLWQSIQFRDDAALQPVQRSN